MRHGTKTTPDIRIRILITCLLIVTATIVPWYVVVLLSLALLLRYDAYEIILVGIFIDALYGAPNSALFGIEFFVTILLTVPALAAPFFKRAFIYYS